MEINKTIDVPREFVFEKIIDSGLYDIERQTGKRPKVMNMTGFSYVKTFGKNQSGTIKFDEVSGPSVYAFTTTTQRNTFHTRWELHKIDDRSTNIIITEQQESNGFFQKLNDIAVGFVLGRIKKRQVIAMIDAIEKAYNGR
ncbi:DUF3284 domain-containing protein [Lactococcus fujiensis]|nr:DUF3284 domain-containing protein [Lactococcus fujiensis]